MKTTRILAILVLALVVCSAQLTKAAPMGSAFTYQGHLYDNNDIADNIYDFQFALYDGNDPCSSNQLGSDVNIPDLDVIDGYFTVVLDFNDTNAFNGDARWLEIGVRPGEMNDSNAYTPLSPRQEVTPVPYALQTRGFFVDEAGNVGIGTTNPQARLHVDGAIRSGNSIVLNGVYDRIEGDKDIAIGFRFFPPPGTPPVDVDPLTFNSINVGIGTIDAVGVPNPTETLDVNGTARIRVLPDDPCLVRVVVADGTGVLYTRDESTLGGGGADDDWWWSFGSGITGDIYHTGDVGIGTASPAAKVDIVNESLTGAEPDAARITFNTTVGSITTHGLQVLSPGLDRKGNQRGVYSETSINPATHPQDGTAQATLASVTGWDASGLMVGVFGRAIADELFNGDPNRTSLGLGGRFIGGPNSTSTLNLDATGTYWVGGAYGEVQGTINNTPASPAFGAVAGLIGIDNAHGSATSYAGYFQGTVRVTELPDGDFNSVVVADSDGVLHTRDESTFGGADNDWSDAGTGWMFATSLTDNVGIGMTDIGMKTNPAAKLTVDGAILRYGSTMLGLNPDTHINLGTTSTTSGYGYATIGGGWNNTASDSYTTVAGGVGNIARNTSATVSGGSGNDANGFIATISGGWHNTAIGSYATIGGGWTNTASTSYATVGGGYSNDASGGNATVPGGLDNTASGQYSFAAGRRARANHDGTFVWGDSTSADFASTGTNQFLIRASGGVGIRVNDPTEDLDVLGTARLRGIIVGGVNTVNVVVDLDGKLWKTASSKRYKTNISDLEISTDAVLELRPVSFQWKTTGHRDIGLIAEEVEEQLKELVIYDKQGRPDAVRYDKVGLYLLTVVKELKAENESLKQRVEAMEEMMHQQPLTLIKGSRQ